MAWRGQISIYCATVVAESLLLEFEVLVGSRCVVVGVASGYGAACISLLYIVFQLNLVLFILISM